MAPEDPQTDFLLLCAHELRTSLTANKWLFEMLLKNELGPVTEEQRVLFTQALAANAHMGTVTKELLKAIHDNTGVIAFTPVSIDLTALCREVVQEFSNLAKKHTLSLQGVYEGIASVQGDATKLRIILHNLLDNAIKYSSPHTSITVRVFSTASQATLTVTNYGPGITLERLPHIFSRFNSTTIDEINGIGLYGSKSLVEQHHGTITVTSIPDETTTFTVSLPLEFAK